MRTCMVVLLSLAATLAAASSIGSTDEKITRKRRDASDFHRDFLREEKAFQAMKSKCTYNEYLDVELLMCKKCEKFCVDNLCGQCREYYSTMKTNDASHDMRLKSERRDMREIGLWICIGFLLVWAMVSTAAIIWLILRYFSPGQPYVTTDSYPHDLDKMNHEVQQHEEETYRSIIKANQKATGKDNRTCEGQVLPRANAAKVVSHPDQDGNCETLVS